MDITVCAYRPWIRDARIIPESEALPDATGYSFPSGHSMNAASLFGGGTIISCFIQTFFIVFIFPLCMKRLEKAAKF